MPASGRGDLTYRSAEEACLFSGAAIAADARERMARVLNCMLATVKWIDDADGVERVY